MNMTKLTKVAALAAIASLSACASCTDENNMTNNNTNNTSTNNTNNTNNTMTPTCDEAMELDVAEYVDGGTIAAGSCYLVNQRFRVDGGQLIIEEGVTLLFNSEIEFVIAGDGRLTIQGTSDAPVFLSSQDGEPGSWKGLSLDTRGADNVLDNFVLEHAGSSGWTGANYSTTAFWATGSAGAEVSGCEIRQNDGHGFVFGNDSEIAISGCTISENEFGGYVHPNVANFVAADNEFVDNATNSVRVSFGNTDAVQTEQTWENIGVPWRIETRMYADAKLTLAAGAVLQFDELTSLIVRGEGRLTAVGTSDDPITFTSVEALRGYWKGISIESTGVDNKLDNVVMEYGGGEAWTGGADTESMLRLNSSSSMEITNSTFRESDNYAVWAQDSVDIAAFEGNTFESNAKIARMHPNTVGQISGDNAFTTNDEQAFRVTFGNTDAVTVAATWAALDVPYLITDRTYFREAVTLEEGTEVQFLENASIVVGQEGSLTAIGTAADPIVFTSVAGEESAGFWKGLEVGTDSVDNQFDYVTIQYAGSDTWYGGADANGALWIGDGSVSITNSTIADITGWGINFGNNGSLTTCTGMTFTNVTEEVFDGKATCN